MFEEVLEVRSSRGAEIHEIVKGLYAQYPALIAASPQQMAIEVALQMIPARQVARENGITVTQLRGVFEDVIPVMFMTAVANAMSRMRHHDRDLERDRRTASAVSEWRDLHPPSGNPDLRTETAVKTAWRNRTQSLEKEKIALNEFRERHAVLHSAPVIELCIKEKGEHRTIDRAFIDSVFPDVA